MRRASISADSERGLSLFSSLHKIGPVDAVSLKDQNKVRIDLCDIFAEPLNGTLVGVGLRQNNFVCILVCSPTDNLDRVSYGAGWSSMIFLDSARLSSSSVMI